MERTFTDLADAARAASYRYNARIIRATRAAGFTVPASERGFEGKLRDFCKEHAIPYKTRAEYTEPSIASFNAADRN